MSNLIRKFSVGFFDKWKAKSEIDKLNDVEFLNMFEQIINNDLSFYMGDGSNEFLEDIAAAYAIKSRHVRDTEILVLRTGFGCIMLTPKTGTTGVHKVDDAHVLGGGLKNKEDLMKVFDAHEDYDVHEITEDEVYNAIIRLEKEQDDLPSLYHFSDRTMKILTEKRG